MRNMRDTQILTPRQLVAMSLSQSTGTVVLAFFLHTTVVSVVVAAEVVVVVVVADAASAVLSGKRSLQFFCEKANLAL